MMNKTYIYTTLIAFLLSISCMAQESTFELNISSDSILLGNFVELSFTAVNIEGEFEGPDLSMFNVVGGPNISSSVSSINGDVRRQITYSYYIEPMDIGSYTIPPAYLSMGETGMETAPQSIEVYPNPNGLIERPSSLRQEFNFNFNDFFDGRSPFDMESSFDSLRQREDMPTATKAKRRKI